MLPVAWRMEQQEPDTVGMVSEDEDEELLPDDRVDKQRVYCRAGVN